MKWNCKTLFALVLALAMMFSLAACTGGTPTPSNTNNPGAAQTDAPGTPDNDPGAAQTTDWSSFEDWANEDWDSKTISYQFTGNWELAEYNYYYTFLINLYDDGSVLVEQRQTASAFSYQQYGYWSEKRSEDGNEISLDTVYCTGVGGQGLVAHEYHYDLYEESDGGYSFGYTFGIAPGSFFREANVTGSSTVTYTSIDGFREAVDHILEIYRFVNTEDKEGFSAVVSVKSDYTAVATLYVLNEGKVTPAHDFEGSFVIDYDTGANTLVIGETQIPLTVTDTGAFGDFPLTLTWDTINKTVEFTMTPAEVVNE